jgi:hypothetical protein
MIRFTSTQSGVGHRGPYYRVNFGNEILVARTFKPFHDACRALVARGLTGPAEHWSEGRHIMTSRAIESSANFTVIENEIDGPRITKYVPYMRSQGGSQLGKTLRRAQSLHRAASYLPKA